MLSQGSCVSSEKPVITTGEITLRKELKVVCMYCIPVVVSNGEGIVAIFCSSLSDQKLSLSAMLYRGGERECKANLGAHSLD